MGFVMKVLFVTEQKIMGGGEYNLLFLIKELQRYDLDIGVLSCNELFLSLLPNTVKKYNYPNISKKGWLSFLPLIWRQLNVYRITGQSWDIIHFYSPNPTCRMLLNCSKKVWTVHGPWEHASGLRGLQLQLFIDRFLPVSDDVRRTCTVTTQKVSCIELGIKPSNYIKQWTFKTPKVFNLLCLGRYQYVKGQDVLLNALHRLQIQLPEDYKINLSFYGEVDQSRPDDILFYEQLIYQSKIFDSSDVITVSFNASSRDIEKLYDWADVCIIPSRYESFSMVAAEALTFGLPIIVSNNGAPHTFLEGKCSGLVFENANADSLASCLMSLISEPEQFCRFSGYRNRFSISRQAEEILEVYNSVMDS